jgi:hypothetical protein
VEAAPVEESPVPRRGTRPRHVPLWLQGGGGTAEERERTASDGGAARLKRLRPRSATA